MFRVNANDFKVKIFFHVLDVLLGVVDIRREDRRQQQPVREPSVQNGIGPEPEEILHVAAEEMQRFGPELLTSMLTYSKNGIPGDL